MNEKDKVEDNISAQNPVNDSDLLFTTEWTTNLLDILENNYKFDLTKQLMNSCAEYHYRAINMDDTVSQYKGKLEEFIEFLSSAWGWKVSYDKLNHVITADENKDACVCPIVHSSKKTVSPSLCHCSEGFAKRMFSAVIMKDVEATVIKSILAGDKSCVYRIHF